MSAFTSVNEELMDQTALKSNKVHKQIFQNQRQGKMKETN